MGASLPDPLNLLLLVVPHPKQKSACATAFTPTIVAENGDYRRQCGRGFKCDPRSLDDMFMIFSCFYSTAVHCEHISLIGLSIWNVNVSYTDVFTIDRPDL